MTLCSSIDKKSVKLFSSDLNCIEYELEVKTYKTTN